MISVKVSYLSHEDLAERFEIFPEFRLRGLPRKSEHDQIGAFILLELLVLGRRALLVILRLAFVGCDRTRKNIGIT